MNGAPTTRQRVAFIIGSLDAGGAERQLIRLVNHLDPARFAPCIVTWSGHGTLAPDLRADIPLVNLPLRRLPLPPRLAVPLLGVRIVLELSRALRRLEPDIVVGYMFAAYVLGAFAARIAGTHTVVAARRGLDSFDRSGRVAGLVGRMANRLIAMHLCNSEAARDVVVRFEGVPRSRTAVIYNGIDLPMLSPPADPIVARARADAEAVAAMLANFIPYKRHDLLVEALALLRASHPRFRVVLYGGGQTRDAIEAVARQQGVDDMVLFAGSRSDAALLLPLFDFSVLCSATESFPNALMESMACGVPVVASAVGGVPELVDDGVSGMLFLPGDASGLANAIAGMIEDPDRRERMGAEARRRIRDKYSVERMVRATEAVLTAVGVGDNVAAEEPVGAG